MLRSSKPGLEGVSGSTVRPEFAGVVRTHARFQSIQILRGVAVAMVLFMHTPVLLPGTMTWWAGPHGTFRHINFSAGVDVFFAISGFVVGRLLLADLAGLGRRERVRRAVRFWSRRAFRLWPTAWLWLVLVYVLSVALPLPDEMRPEKEFPMMLAGIGMFADLRLYHATFDHFDSGIQAHYWSLSLEEQFYLLMPLLLILVPRRALLTMILLLVVWYLVPANVITRSTFRCESLIAGVGLATVEGAAAWRWLGRGVVAIGRVGRAVAVVGSCVAAMWLSGVGYSERLLGVKLVLVEPVLLACVCVMLVAGAASGEDMARRLGRWRDAGLVRRPLLWLGERSYVLYVVHPPAYSLTHYAMVHFYPVKRQPGSHVAVEVLIAAGLLLMLTEATARLVEQPLRRMGRQAAPDRRL